MWSRESSSNKRLHYTLSVPLIVLLLVRSTLSYMQIKSLFASNVNAHSACNYRTLSPLRPDTTDVSVGQCSEGCGRCTLYHWTHWSFLEPVLFDWYYNCLYHIKRSKTGKVFAFWKINQQSPYTLKRVHSNFLVVLIVQVVVPRIPMLEHFLVVESVHNQSHNLFKSFKKRTKFDESSEA